MIYVHSICCIVYFCLRCLRCLRPRHKYCCDKVPIACGPKIPRRSVNTLQPKTLCFGHQRQQVKLSKLKKGEAQSFMPKENSVAPGDELSNDYKGAQRPACILLVADFLGSACLVSISTTFSVSTISNPSDSINKSMDSAATVVRLYEGLDEE